MKPSQRKEMAQQAREQFTVSIRRTARHEGLELPLFETIEQAQLLATQWLWSYNNERPHTAIGGIPPRQ